MAKPADPLQSYLAARKLKEQTANQLARDEGALARVLDQLRQETGQADVTEAETLLRKEQDKLTGMEEQFQGQWAEFQQAENERLGGEK